MPNNLEEQLKRTVHKLQSENVMKERTIQHLLEYLKMSLTPETVKMIHSDAILKRVNRSKALEDVYRHVKTEIIPKVMHVDYQQMEVCDFRTYIPVNSILGIIEVVERDY